MHSSMTGEEETTAGMCSLSLGKLKKVLVHESTRIQGVRGNKSRHPRAKKSFFFVQS